MGAGRVIDAHWLFAQHLGTAAARARPSSSAACRRRCLDAEHAAADRRSSRYLVIGENDELNADVTVSQGREVPAGEGGHLLARDRPGCGGRPDSIYRATAPGCLLP
jgi:hypothetical protein